MDNSAMEVGDPGRLATVNFDALYDAHIREIHAYCLRRMPPEDAQDAAAEVFAVVWRRRAQLPSGDESLPWIYGVARNVLANRDRSIRRRLRLEAKLRSLPSGIDVGPEAASERDVDRQRVLHALSLLSDTDQEVLRLLEWEGLTRAQVASMLGVSRSAIDRRIGRAYRKLRAILDRDDKGDRR
jgi:RNA polymerase sigma-70 factor (ECF subfamily)